MAADEPEGETHQDLREGRLPRPLRRASDGRDRGFEGIAPGNPAADRRTTTETGKRRTGTAGCIVAMGGLCLNAEEKGQIGGSNVVCDGGDDENAGSTAQARRCLPGNCAVCYRLRRSRVHLGNVG